MNPENENIDLFEAYLKGSLSVEERLNFEGKLISDAAFKNEFKDYKSLEASVKKYYRAEMKTKLTEIDERLDVPKTKVISLQWWLASGAAAIIIFGLFIFSNQNISSKKLVAQYWPYESGLPVKMSEKNKYDDAMNAFKLEEWSKAEILLKPMASDTAHYYLGVLNYELKDYSSSFIYFKEINVNSSFYDESQFRLALIAVLQDDLNFAKDILKTQAENETSFSDEAKVVLKELED